VVWLRVIPALQLSRLTDVDRELSGASWNVKDNYCYSSKNCTPGTGHRQMERTADCHISFVVSRFTISNRFITLVQRHLLLDRDPFVIVKP